VLQLNNGSIHLFPSYIWKYQYDFNYEKLKTKIDRLFSLVETNSKLEKGNAISTVSVDQTLQPHTWEELSEFQQWLGSTLEHIKDTYRFVERQSTVTQSWINRHGYDGITEEHNHNFSTFVVSCYLNCPLNSGNIEFKDPLEYHFNSWPIEPEEILYKEIPVTTNDVIIFPGWLRHRVQPNQSHENRFVMTFNIK
jgi:uncharacterized protein (TIGR02466 family)